MSIVRNSTKQQDTTTQPNEMNNCIHISDERMDHLKQEQYTFGNVHA